VAPPASTGTFSPIHSSTYIGAICEVIPAGPPDPFHATGTNLTSLLLSYGAGAATLGTAFSSSWKFGADAPVQAWGAPPCGYWTLSTIDSGCSYKYLYWSSGTTTATVWNAVAGGYLTYVASSSATAAASTFLACKIATSSTWFLFLQLGTDIPTENVFGEPLVPGSCVSTLLSVA